MSWKDEIKNGINCVVGSIEDVEVHVYLKLNGQYSADRFFRGKFIGRIEYYSKVDAIHGENIYFGPQTDAA